MILIIDTYTFPASKIETLLHLSTGIELTISDVTSKSFKSENYFIHKEKMNGRDALYKYYFNEVYEVRNDKLFYYNKKKNTWKIYCYVNGGLKEEKLVRKEESRAGRGRDDVLQYFSVESGENEVIRDIDDEEL